MAGEIYYPNVTGAFDWGTLLDGLIKVESYRIQRLELQKQTIDQKLKALNDLKSKIEDLYNFTSGISVNDWFNKKTVENNNPDIVDVSIVNNNIPEYVAQGTVNKVAQIEISYFSRTFSSPDEQFNPDEPDKEYTLTLRYNTVDGQTIEKDFTFKGSDTLQSLIDQINNDPDISKYLHAYTMYTGDGYRFAIMEKDVAASADESTEGTYDSGDLEEVLGDYVIMQGAKNSELQIGDQTFDNPDYNFVDILPGLKIRVKQPGDFSVTIKTDYDGIAQKFVELVDKVNNIIRTINNLTKITRKDDQVTGPTISDYSLKELKIRLQNLFQPLLSDPNIAKYNVVNFNDDGTITVDKTALKNFLEENPKENWDVLYQVVENAKDLSNLALNDAYIAPLIKSYEDMERNLEERINYYQEYLQEKEEFLKKRFASVESYIAQLQQVQAKINSILTAQMLF
ncbi:MAG TPA: hypothetical protein EYO62_00295 [Aquificales bacterium]|nr:hypothetical protein [Aquificales bacterium]